MALEPGLLLNKRYRIQEVISRGGMGAVYKAVDESLSMQVAVKENLFFNPDASRQFRREATLLAGLRHPNLPRVTDHFSLPKKGEYLVMDFISGEDLRQRIERVGPLPDEEAALIGVAVCGALTYLHKCQPPVIHRDVKPGNIKITQAGQVYLVDFGLARVSHEGQSTTSGAQALTPGFAPPEQYRQGTEPRSDLYALGASLYAALTGSIPEDSLSIVMNSAKLTRPRKVVPGISQRMEGVILKAMSMDPSQRYSSAQEFASALLDADTSARKRMAPDGSVLVSPAPSDASTQITIRVGMPTPPAGIITQASMRKSSSRNFVWIGGILAILAVLAIVAGSFLFNKLAASSEKTHSTIANASDVAPGLDTPGPPMTAALSSTSAAIINRTERPEATLEATPIGGGNGQIAYVTDKGGLPQIWVMDVNGKNQKKLTDLPDGACQPDWSPDGKKIVFISPCRAKQEIYRGAALFLIRADGTGLRPLPSLPGGDFDPRWSPDGSRIVFTSIRDGNPHLFLLVVKDMQTTPLSNPSNVDRQPAWSPDGKTLAFVTTRLGSLQVWLMNSDGTSPREFSDLQNGSAVGPVWSPDRTLIIFSQTSSLRLVARQVANRFSKEVPISERLSLSLAPRFSPDGLWVVFESWLDGNHNIYRIMRNGTQLTQLTSDPAMEFQPAWQPTVH